jgi:hypothetical protein
MEYLVPAPPVVAGSWVAEEHASRRLIIRLIIQTIRRDPSGADQIDEASNVSRLDRSGADQIDVEHQAPDLVLSAVELVLLGQRRGQCSALFYLRLP